MRMRQLVGCRSNVEMAGRETPGEEVSWEPSFGAVMFNCAMEEMRIRKLRRLNF
jgi:hypothetical protein